MSSTPVNTAGYYYNFRNSIRGVFDGQGPSGNGFNGTDYYFGDPATSNYTQIRSQWGNDAADLYLNVNRFANPLTIDRLGGARKQADYEAGVRSATVFSDNSLVYHYAGDPNGDVIVQTPRDWSGGGLPQSVTQGASGWSVTKPLPAGEEFTLEELKNDYGLYWAGPSMGEVADAAKQLYGGMTDITRGTTRQMTGELYNMAEYQAEKTIKQFPAVSNMAMAQTAKVEKTLSQDMSQQFVSNLDTYLPGWRQNLEKSGALTQGSGAIAQAFKDFYPQLAYDTLETTAMLRNASRPMAAGEVPMSVSLSTMGANPSAYGRSTAYGRGLTARDLGLNTATLRQLGTAGLDMAGRIQPYLQQATGTIMGTPADFARTHAASVGQFVAPMVDTSSLYGSLMKGLAAGSEMTPDQIFKLGMSSYAQETETGMNTFAMLQQLAQQQTETYNANLNKPQT